MQSFYAVLLLIPFGVYYEWLTLTKTKNIRKKKIKTKQKMQKLQKEKKVSSNAPGEATTKQIRTLGSEIIATRTEDDDNGRQTDEFRFHELC